MSWNQITGCYASNQNRAVEQIRSDNGEDNIDEEMLNGGDNPADGDDRYYLAVGPREPPQVAR